jgi:hypothetical protein
VRRERDARTQRHDRQRKIQNGHRDAALYHAKPVAIAVDRADAVARGASALGVALGRTCGSLAASTASKSAGRSECCARILNLAAPAPVRFGIATARGLTHSGRFAVGCAAELAGPDRFGVATPGRIALLRRNGVADAGELADIFTLAVREVIGKSRAAPLRAPSFVTARM